MRTSFKCHRLWLKQNTTKTFFDTILNTNIFANKNILINRQTTTEPEAPFPILLFKYIIDYKAEYILE